MSNEQVFEKFKSEAGFQIYHGIFMLHSIGLSYKEIEKVIEKCFENVKTEVKENT